MVGVTGARAAAAAAITPGRDTYQAAGDAAYLLGTHYLSMISLGAGGHVGPEYPAAHRLFAQSRAYRTANLDVSADPRA